MARARGLRVGLLLGRGLQNVMVTICIPNMTPSTTAVATLHPHCSALPLRVRVGVLSSTAAQPATGTHPRSRPSCCTCTIQCATNCTATCECITHWEIVAVVAHDDVAHVQVSMAAVGTAALRALEKATAGPDCLAGWPRTAGHNNGSGPAHNTSNKPHKSQC
jgi:hypothetical protein